MGPPTTTDRLDRWRDLIRDHFVALDIDADRGDVFGGAVRADDVGDLNVADVASCTQLFTRTRELARADPEVYLQVGLLTRGAAVIQQDGREAVLRPGDFALYETDRPFRWGISGDWELLVFTWPRASIRLHDTVSQALTARRLSGTSGLGRPVGRMLRDLVEAPPALSTAGGLRLSQEVADLVATVALEAARPGGEAPHAADLLRRIDGYIAEQLGDPNLCPAGIAAAHHISTRHLHRLFAGRDCTVAHRIQQLRLEHARQDLCAPSRDSWSITDVAYRWGFADLATFSRAFRTVFGMTPTQCRARRASEAAGC